MNINEEERSCYCSQRGNTDMNNLFKDIPEGFCGVCDVCGEYGHLNAHPTMPTSGSWCDKHYKELLVSPSIDLSQVFGIGITIFYVAIMIFYGFYR